MSAFQFHTPKTLEEALSALRDAGARARVVAGGTNVVPMLREGRPEGGLLLDISRLEALRGIAHRGDAIRIGALTTLHDIVASRLLADKAPALRDAALVFADPLIRGRATVGGNLANASPGADTAPPLLALDAELVVAGPEGQRTIPLAAFFPGEKRTALGPAELITEIIITPNPKSAFHKIGLRGSMAVSVATAAVALLTDGAGVITDCRVALGALSSRPVRALETEAVLRGRRVRDLGADVGDALQRDIQPRDGLRGTANYRRGIVFTLFQTALHAINA